MEKLNINEIKENIIVEGGKSIKELFSSKWYRQIPNLITSSRALAPFVVTGLVFSGNIIGSIVAMIGFALTDGIDGFIARTFKLQSKFGKILDPICDKIFAIGVLIPVITSSPILVLNVLLEAVITCINTLSSLKNNKPKTVLFGKIKTASLSISIILCYLSLLGLNINLVKNLSIIITTILQFKAISDYHDEDKKKDFEKSNNEKINIIDTNIETDEQVKDLEKTDEFNTVMALLKVKEELTSETKEEKIKTYIKK